MKVDHFHPIAMVATTGTAASKSDPTMMKAIYLAALRFDVANNVVSTSARLRKLSVDGFMAVTSQSRFLGNRSTVPWTICLWCKKQPAIISGLGWYPVVGDQFEVGDELWRVVNATAGYIRERVK